MSAIDKIAKERTRIEGCEYSSIDEAMRDLLAMLKDCGYITRNCYKSMTGMLKSKRSSRFAVLKYIRRHVPRVVVVPRIDNVKVVFVRGGGFSELSRWR
jgi:hypothetical protein